MPADCLCLIAVPDPAIASTAARLEGTGVAFVHLSGSYGLELLKDPARRGHPVGALHPLQSFPEVRDRRAFANVFFAIDASTTDLLEDLSDLAKILGGWALPVRGEQRLIYHAAANLAGPLLIALVSEAVRCLELAGLEKDEALDALLPFLAGTLENLGAYRLPGALIGPIRRGDAATVDLHLRTLAPSARAIYGLLSHRAVELAVEAGLGASAAEMLRLTLNSNDRATR